MRQMGLRAVFPKPRTSQAGKGHKIDSYLLNGLSIDRANKVWASDICYIPMAKGGHVPDSDHVLVFATRLDLARFEYVGH